MGTTFTRDASVMSLTCSEGVWCVCGVWGGVCRWCGVGVGVWVCVYQGKVDSTGSEDHTLILKLGT